MPFTEALNEQTDAGSKRLGKLPARSSVKQLHFARFAAAAAPLPPPSVSFWNKRAPFPAYTYGNTEHGCCTIASQAVMATRLERLEQRRTVGFAEDEILRVYYALTAREYGGGDTGAYETDALDNWRNPDLTFRDGKGRPHTIDAYLRVNHADINEVKRAIAFSGAHGIKVCYSLPAAWSNINMPDAWDIPEGQPMVGPWQPNSWGGHSMAAAAGYLVDALQQPHTWYKGGREIYYGIQRVTWRAVAGYMDEAYIVIDSVNAWKKQGLLTKRQAEMIVSAVNEVSDTKIAA